MRTPDVSIIICTCDRPASLRQTLQTLTGVEVPAALTTELLVVDNGSRESARAVVESHVSPQMPVRYLVEPRRGQCHARNTAVAAAWGQIILFTDDDTRLPRDWIAAICAPIIEGRAHAVAGGVRLATHLDQAWVEPIHRTWLASTEELNPDSPPRMVGANMAFSRTVLTRVTGFDTELGPGALGYYDETLFAWQLLRAGFSLAAAFEAPVEHHCDPSRLTRAGFMTAARSMGRAHAYVTYHWEHRDICAPRRQTARAVLRLACWRIRRQRRGKKEPARMPVWEMQLLRDIHFYRQFQQEQKRPRRYEQFGLLKLDS